MKKSMLIPFALYLLMIICLGAATFVEKYHGTEFVARHVYHSWWFIAAWGALFASTMVVAIARKLYRNIPAFLMHLSFGVILAGALITFLTTQKGYVHLRAGEPTQQFQSEEPGEIFSLPFTISLESFEVEYYKGTQAPADYASNVKIEDGGAVSRHHISMNNILSHRGYRFYQTSFDEDMQGSILSVNRDPYGIPATYAGYILLGLSMLMLLLSPRGGFRKLLTSLRLKQIGVTAVLLVLGVGSASAAPATLTQDEAAAFGRLQMLYNGRVAPVQTFAREFTLKLCGKSHYGDFTAEQVVAGWIFYPEQWQHEKMIKVKSDDVRQILSSGEAAAFTDFFDAERNYKLAPYRNRLYQGGGADKTIKAIGEADERVQLITMLQSGEFLSVFPVRGDAGLTWLSPADPVDDFPRGDSLFVKGIFPLIYQAVKDGDHAKIEELIAKIDAYQHLQGGSELLSPLKLKAELYYNRLDMATMLYRLNLTFGILAFAYFCWSFVSARRKRWVEALFLVQLIHSLAFLTVNLSLRGYIAGHLPLSNGYETMMFIAWCILLITVIFRRRFFLVTAAGFTLSGFALLVSALGSMNPQITHLMPVLASPWLSIHVSLIMVSYALLGFVFFNGLTALILMLACGKENKEKTLGRMQDLQLVSRLFLYPALFLLTAGIFVGAVWANVSWGRYWGWAPKEVWALVTMMIYAIVFHLQNRKGSDSVLFFHSFAVVAFYSVLMTYFGVNYMLGGMHSYAGESTFSPVAFCALIPAAVVAAACIKHRLSGFSRRKTRP